MFHPAIAGSNGAGAALQDVLAVHRVAAARAFRALRDLRALASGDAIELVVRAQEPNVLVAFAHPGLWSVTLEPTVTILDATGARLSGDAQLAADLEPVHAVFGAHSQLTVIGRAYAPHLAAWSQTGQDFDFHHGPLKRFTTARRFRRLDDEDQLAAAAADPRNAGALSPDGRLTVWGDDIAATAELIALGEQAAQIKHLAAGFGVREPLAVAAPVRRTLHAASA